MISLELMARYSAIRETCLHHITGHRPMTMADQLAAIGEQTKQFAGPDVYGTGELIEPAAVLLELPMREIGGQLPSWEELDAQSQWARQQGITLHMDGARLWQCPPHYGRSLTEITALFNSVYVSFYKDIGGIAGSVLAGSVDFIDQAKMLIRRAGGNLYSLFPYVLAARAGMQRNLATLPDAVADAAWLAERFNDIQGLKTLPHLPPTNLFHLYMKGDPQSLITRACQWSEQHKVFLLPVPRAIADDYSVIEFSIEQALRSAPRDQWQHWLDSFFAEPHSR